MALVHPMYDLLVRNDLVTGWGARLEQLVGGVSSDIWLVDDGWRRFVVKQPLAELKVADEWHAPLARSDSEAGWLQVVGSLVPGACPQVLAYDAPNHFLALEYLDPDHHTLWKADLLAGRVDPRAATRVGDRLGAIHRLTSERPDLADQFATDELFVTLRIEPYLWRLVDRYPEVEARIDELVATTMGTKLALVHGDASPKNILLGPHGPVFLDAETAWWGDPAFDIAFCLNHLLLKALLPGTPVDRLLMSVGQLVAAYRPHVAWENADVLFGRVAALLPALMLARVDGRSPVEYLDEGGRSRVRDFALPRLRQPRPGLTDLVGSWKDALS